MQQAAGSGCCLPLRPVVARVAAGTNRRAGACSRVGVSEGDDLRVLRAYG